MTLLTYVRDADTDTALFAVVADDAGAEYVWPADAQPWFEGTTRLDFLIQALGEEPPTDELAWLQLATTHLGDDIEIDEPFDDLSTTKDALSAAKTYLKTQVRRVPAAQNPDAEEAFDQVSADYAGFGESVDTLSAEAMDNFVMMMLGPIDPEGPNGWILRAQDGNPAPGDENEFLHMPGASTIMPQEDPE